MHLAGATTTRHKDCTDTDSKAQLGLVSIIDSHTGQRFQYDVLVTLQSLDNSLFALYNLVINYYKNFRYNTLHKYPHNFTYSMVDQLLDCLYIICTVCALVQV